MEVKDECCTKCTAVFELVKNPKCLFASCQDAVCLKCAQPSAGVCPVCGTHGSWSYIKFAVVANNKLLPASRHQQRPLLLIGGFDKNVRAHALVHLGGNKWDQSEFNLAKGRVFGAACSGGRVRVWQSSPRGPFLREAVLDFNSENDGYDWKDYIFSIAEAVAVHDDRLYIFNSVNPSCSLQEYTCFRIAEGLKGFTVTYFNGKILLVGGFHELVRPVATVLVYDPVTLQVESGPDLLEARAYHSAVVLQGKLFVIGGLVGEMKVSRTCQVFDGERWQMADIVLPEPLMPTSSIEEDGAIAVVGGFGQDYRSRHAVHYLTLDGSYRQSQPFPIELDGVFTTLVEF